MFEEQRGRIRKTRGEMVWVNRQIRYQIRLWGWTCLIVHSGRLTLSRCLSVSGPVRHGHNALRGRVHVRPRWKALSLSILLSTHKWTNTKKCTSTHRRNTHTVANVTCPTNKRGQEIDMWPKLLLSLCYLSVFTFSQHCNQRITTMQYSWAGKCLWEHTLSLWK